MPQEQINYPAEPVSTTLHLNWGASDAGGNLQASLGIPFADLREFIQEQEEQARITGSYPEKLWFYTEQLSRPEVQNLIRTARRARNAVYGGDE